MVERKLYIGIFVFLIVLSLIFVIGNSSFNITGRLGSEFRTCIESDGGDNYNVTGDIIYTVRSNEYKYTDYCFARAGSSKKWLNEYYCNSNEEVSSRDYNCEIYGIRCSDGRCLPKETGPCDDSDFGLDYSVKGKVCVNSGCKEDLCLDKIYLSESYCKDGEIASKIQKCNQGCEQGKCISDVKEAEIETPLSPEVEEKVAESEEEKEAVKVSFWGRIKRFFGFG